MKKYCICIVYVDDTRFAGPDVLLLEREINSLGVKEYQCDHSFQLRYEGGVGDFLGIRIEKQKGNSFLLTQTGLIEKAIKAGGMEDCNKVATLAETSPAGADLDGLPFNETWEYAVDSALSPSAPAGQQANSAITDTPSTATNWMCVIRTLFCAPHIRILSPHKFS
jgi:hypothetical protein